jgi:hypothetical protein
MENHFQKTTSNDLKLQQHFPSCPLEKTMVSVRDAFAKMNHEELTLSGHLGCVTREQANAKNSPEESQEQRLLKN